MERKKQNRLKKDQSKSYHNITIYIVTVCVEYKHKNTRTSCNSIRISGLQRFNSSTECRKTVSLKAF